RQRVADRVHPGAAEALRHRHAQQAELGEPRHDLLREAMLAVDGGGVGRDLPGREVARGLPDQLLLGRELEVHVSSLYADRYRPLHLAGRFSTKARLPSFWSAVENRAAKSWRSSSLASASGRSAPRRMARFVSAIASGALAAMVSATARARGMRSA